LTIGKHFKIIEADRKKLEDWDGKEELPLATMVKDSGANPKELTKPNDTIQQIYKEAAQYLNKLLIDPVDEPTLGRLRAMNDKIKTQNGKDGVSPVEQWTIDVGGLGAQFNKAKPFYDRLLEDEHDGDAKQELEKIRTEMAKSYPDAFSVQIPTPEIRAEQKAAADKAAADKEAADKEAADKAAADKAAADKAAADKEAKEYPWKTLDTPDGRRIMAGRQHSKLGKVQDKSTLIVATDLSDDPIYDMTAGSNVGTLEVEEFFKLDGIKLLADKRENGEDVKTWTWRDKEDFVEFLWCTRGTRDTTTFGKGSKAPDTYCGVRMKKGIEVLTRSNLVRVIGKKSTDSRIKAYCERKGITPPWDVEAQNEKVPKEKKLIAAQTWLAEQGLGNFASPAAGLTAGNSGAGYSMSGWTKVNSTLGNSMAGSSDIKLLTERIDAMEKQIRTQSSNTGGSSLDSLLKKMDSMEANMNKRMDTMETKITQVDALTTNMNNLSSVVGLLMEKAGLNAASG
jgi:hypothetical protein